MAFAILTSLISDDVKKRALAMCVRTMGAPPVMQHNKSARRGMIVLRAVDLDVQALPRRQHGLNARTVREQEPYVRKAARYAWERLSVGDAAFFAADRHARPEEAAYCYGARTGTRFSARSYVHDGVVGTLVKRIA